MQSPSDWNILSPLSSSSSSHSSEDEDSVNSRVFPCWDKYRCLLDRRGFGLETIRDVKEYHRVRSNNFDVQQQTLYSYFPRYIRVSASLDDSALCKDTGLGDNLFRAIQYHTRKKVIIKAVHLQSREYDVIRFLSTPPIRNDPTNHCIPILDLIEVPMDDICFIAMEEWSSNLIPETPSCLRQFLDTLRQCVEHTAFMHSHQIVHLDISLHNFLTDHQGQCAAIDYEISRRYDSIPMPRIYEDYRGTEIPPELEQGHSSDPYKVDVWALGVLIHRACMITGYNIPALTDVTKWMLNDDPDKRPCTSAVLQAFRHIMAMIDE